MTLGFDFKSFGPKIGVRRSTLYNWVKKHPEFDAAKGVAEDASRRFYWNLILDNLQIELDHNGKPTRQFNTTMVIAIMNNRFWKKDDKKPGDVDKAQPAPIVLTADAALELLKAARGK